MFAPIHVLTILVLVLILAVVVVRVQQRRLRRSLRRFAINHRYQYAEIDRFDLARRTPVSHLTLGPVVAADARHVLYRRNGSLRELVFVVDLLVGGSSPKRDRLIIRADEPCDDPAACDGRNDSTGRPPMSKTAGHSSAPPLTVRSHTRVERNILSSISRLLG
jgi:hypothetical protein